MSRIVTSESLATAHHLLLPLVLSGDEVVGFVRGLCAGRADAGVVAAAVDLQETLVFLADLLLQVESGFDQTVRRQSLHLGISAKRKTVVNTT